jgi:hypothetical protein
MARQMALDSHALASGMPLIPVAFLGVLIGIVTGIVFALFLGAAYKSSSIGAVLKVTPQLLAIPTFWFGGPWVTAELLNAARLDELVDSYVVFLAITFTAFVLGPAIRLIILISKRIREAPDAE